MNILDLLFPPLCAGCRAFGTWWCPQCIAALTAYREKTAPPLTVYPGLTATHSAVEYVDSAQQLVQRVKYQFQTIYVPILAQEIEKSCGIRIRQLHPDVIIPVPLHRSRLAWRGFNQSAMLARELGKIWNIPVDTTSLTRKNARETQAHGNRSSRTAIQNDFHCKKAASLKNKHVLLVDDVLTTGNTLAACARALDSAQIKKTTAVTFARAV